jgi:hypothetical protein
VCASIAAESVPIAREHIPVPDHRRVADEPPHIENDVKVKLFSNRLAEATATVTLSIGAAVSLADGNIITSSPPPPPITFMVWRPDPSKA